MVTKLDNGIVTCESNFTPAETEPEGVPMGLEDAKGVKMTGDCAAEVDIALWMTGRTDIEVGVPVPPDAI